MGDEVHTNEYENGIDSGDGERVLEWEDGLPSADDLTPLSQPLIPPKLASAFSIAPYALSKHARCESCVAKHDIYPLSAVVPVFLFLPPQVVDFFRRGQYL
uniref:Uncharacterized protein n=1 Tax=Nelumbo nucifera TaxID=4432 RepID=A0A822YX29_NELNU|nr:TPA_asm: hypothetical protein HUJ06_006731 [Nelumbo nucifera]